MARTYTSAARRAAAQAPTDPHDQTGLLAWVGRFPARARQALRLLDEHPVDPADTGAVAARARLVEQLLDVFPSFELDGEVFRAYGELQLLDLCEITKLNRAGALAADPTSLAALSDIFAGALGQAENERFRAFCRANAVDPDTLNDIMEGLMEDLSEVPTSRPSPSPGGPSTSGPTSRVVSLSPHTAGPAPMSSQEFADFMQGWEPAPAGPPTPPASPLGLPTPGPVSYG